MRVTASFAKVSLLYQLSESRLVGVLPSPAVQNLSRTCGISGHEQELEQEEFLRMPRAAMLKGIIWIAALACCAVPSSANAQGYPSRPITVVVPFPPGGPSDVVARIVIDHMGRTLGHLFVENVAGAGGTIGSARVAMSTPDGYTLLAGSMGSHVAA